MDSIHERRSLGFIVIILLGGIILCQGSMTMLITEESPVIHFQDIDWNNFSEYPETPYIPGSLLIKVKPGVDVSNFEKAGTIARQITAFNDSYEPIHSAQPVFSPEIIHENIEQKTKIGLDRWIRITLDDAIAIETEVEKYKNHPLVEYAEPNYVAQICGIPNDPYFLWQWSLYNYGQLEGPVGIDIDALAAWDLETGDANVTIAIVDTGVDYNHPDLADNIWVNAGEDLNKNGIIDQDEINGIDDDLNNFTDDFYGYDFCSYEKDWDNDPMDENGHGTFCSGIAAAITNNHEGIAGVCPNGRIMALRVFNELGYGYLEDTAAAIIYAADNGADVISNSWGAYGSIKLLHEAIKYASRSAILVAAAGNDDRDWVICFPAAYDEVISVAGTNQYDQKTSSSNYGMREYRWVDIAAPGYQLIGTFLGDPYVTSTGTSVATPIVSGVAALLKSHFPDWSNELLIGQMLSTAENIDRENPGLESLLGSGRINAFNALTYEPGMSLILKQYVVYDPYGDNDWCLDPGESIDLYIVLRNNWLNATDIKATLMTLHPDVSLVSPSVYYDDMAPLEQAMNHFSITLDPGASRSQLIEFELHLTASCSVRELPTGQYETIIPFTVEVPHQFQAGWPVASYYGTPLSPPAVGDIDGDNDPEIVMGGYDGLLYAFHHDGRILEGWPVCIYPYYLLYVPPTLADVDEDGKLEVFFYSSICALPDTPKRMIGIDDNGSFLEGWQKDLWGTSGSDRSLGSPAIGDLDNDSDLEIVLPENDYLYAWDHEGTPVNTLAMEVPGENFGGTPALADVDHDGDLEIFVSGTKVYGWHHDGSAVEGFPTDLQGEESNTPPVIADLDNNGELEIIASHKKLSCLTATGNIIWTKDYRDWFNIPALGDLDGDSDLEIVIALNEPGLSGFGPISRLYAFHHDGTIVRGWPLEKASAASSAAWGFPVLGDINGDGAVEVILTSYEKIEAYNGDGTMVDGFPIDPFQCDHYPPIITFSDMDADGDVEVVYCSDLIYVFDLSSQHIPIKMQWPQFSHDIHHTNYYERCFEVDLRGPYNGQENERVLFTSIVNDGCPPYTWNWDFGDGETSPKQNAIHIYQEAGTYTVTLSVYDSQGRVTNKTTTATITDKLADPEETILEIGKITGGFGGIQAVIKNIGSEDAINCRWSIVCNGGIVVIPRNGVKEDWSTKFAAGDQESIKTKVFGIGGFRQSLEVIVTVQADNADPVEKRVPARVFLSYVILGN